MQIKRTNIRPKNPGPAEWFTGAVQIEPLQDAQPPSRTAAASVTFQPGARTAWHTHPLGQLLIVTAGHGWVCRWGGPREEIHPGDVIRFDPGEKHWHGATDTSPVTHIAVQEAQDGNAADWLEHVTDDQYHAA